MNALSRDTERASDLLHCLAFSVESNNLGVICHPVSVQKYTFVKSVCCGVP
jgi:hypothetical protein